MAGGHLIIDRTNAPYPPQRFFCETLAWTNKKNAQPPAPGQLNLRQIKGVAPTTAKPGPGQPVKPTDQTSRSGMPQANGPEGARRKAGTIRHVLDKRRGIPCARLQMQTVGLSTTNRRLEYYKPPA